MLKKVLVANRGEIACRIIRTLKEMGIASVAVYSDADVDAAHVGLADEAFNIGPAPARDSYLNIDAILAIMRDNGVDAVHPGYGFLSENVAFSEACAGIGVEFIGPETRHILEFGLKHKARELAEQAGVPLVPGTPLLNNVDEALEAAERIGYPVMLKSTAGGGGIGMRICNGSDELETHFETIQRLGKNYFKDDGVFLEKYIRTSRHIEVQVFGNGNGKVVVLGERDCSVQRRNQKVVEETPAPNISEETRLALHDAAKRLAESVAYRSAGTVEFIYDTETASFYFLEVNTRLQVEHGITEEVFGIDLVRWMVELAGGEDPIAETGKLSPSGCAMEFRIYAEDPGKEYQPSSGLVTCAEFPENIRCDGWVETGSEVSAYYDPLLAKIIVKGSDRTDAIARSRDALNQTRICGFETNLDLHRQILQHEAFFAGNVFTGLLDGMDYVAHTIEVLSPGTQTTVQDVPGRRGFWGVGVPPSGPMDDLHFQIANRLVGNRPTAAALEMTMTGGAYRFNAATTIALTGGSLTAKINDQEIPLFEAIDIEAGDTLTIGIFEAGQRAYLAIRGGVDVPDYMGSKSTFILGRFGGHGGRALATGDILHIGAETAEEWPVISLPENARPEIGHHWQIGVMYGPHGAPDFFTDQDIETFFNHDWEVHFNSSRTGVRLIGPKPKWARSDGGEAGLHPSNIHDNAYAIGAIDFTGDMPVILGPDGPSLGGFVCPATVIESELWKVGQLQPGDTIRFIPVELKEARYLDAENDQLIEKGEPLSLPRTADYRATPSVVAEWSGEGELDRMVCRQAGDRYILIEFGPLQLDLRLRFKVHAWHLKFEELALPGVIDLTPGIRSLQIHFNPALLRRVKLLDIIASLREELGAHSPVEVESRIVHLPLSWDDPQTRLAIEKYTSSVRKNAPWCPSNIEFIRRINGLGSEQDVHDVLFNASYLVMGLGDVYLGAPVATPIDPRHRLVTTKYNPARTWTPENAVGIGGAYLCVYGMEGPGGYQFVGRTVQMWNRYHATREFEPGKPWLLRCFDQIRFHPVEAEELLDMRRDFLKGRFSLQIEKTTFNIEAYNRFLAQNEASISAFKARQQQAFSAEYQHWVENNLLSFEEPETVFAGREQEIMAGATAVSAAVGGSVWQCRVAVGDTINEGDAVVVLESMKTEIPIPAPCAGEIVQVFCNPGETVKQGQPICAVMPS